MASQQRRVGQKRGAACPNPSARPAFTPAPTPTPVISITGQTAVIVEPYGYTVELINLKTRHVFPPSAVGAFPAAVAITA
jgi:hypothetical protein